MNIWRPSIIRPRSEILRPDGRPARTRPAEIIGCNLGVCALSGGGGGLLAAAHGPGYAWNPADKSASVVLSSSNYLATASSQGYKTVRAAKAITSGKWYWELKITNTGGNVYPSFMDNTSSIATIDAGGPPGSSPNGTSWSSGVAAGTYATGVTADYTGTPTWVVNDILGYAIDYAAGKLWIHKNGTYFNSGDPAGGTGPVIHWTAGTRTWFPCFGPWDNAGAALLIDGFGNPFNYSPPAGFGYYSDIP